MSDEIRSESDEAREKANAEMQAQYEEGWLAIGRFLFEFSQLEFSIKTVLGFRLGLDGRDFDTVTAPYDFVMLCTVFQKVVARLAPGKAASVADFANECRSLNEKRVRVAHGMWSLGEAGLVARHVPRGTLDAKFHFGTTDELHRLADQAQSLLKRALKFEHDEAHAGSQHTKE